MMIIDKVKQSYKRYYSNKNWKYRYFFIAFLFLIIVIQFIGVRKYKQPLVQSDAGISFAGELIPMTGKAVFNQEKIDREIAITKLNTAQFVMIHKREPQYLPYITKELKKAGIPEDFKYLAVAESALRNVAYSSAGAAGIWQFMPSTAQGYGLTVNELVDERLNFEKATDAAISYLSDLYDNFGDWALVAAAYNRWGNGLVRDMSWQYQDNYFDLRLNNETSRYVFRIAAIKYLMENRYTHFDPKVLGEQYSTPRTKTEKVGAVEDLALWAKERDMSYSTLRLLNPWIKNNSLPEWKRELKVF